MVQNDLFLTYIHNFSAIILRKIFFVREVPLFHLWWSIYLTFSVLDEVELWWNYGGIMGGTSCNSTHIPPLIPPPANA